MLEKKSNKILSLHELEFKYYNKRNIGLNSFLVSLLYAVSQNFPFILNLTHLISLPLIFNEVNFLVKIKQKVGQ